MRAALYLRRSKEEHQVESLGVQVEGAKRFVESKGWQTTHVFTEGEDGSDTSRAEFKKRPKLIQMLNAAKDRAFDVLVVRDETRLGGDMIRTTLLLQDLVDAGCRILYYYSGEEVRLSDATARFMVASRNFAAELEREKISQRTHENLMRKAEKGLVTGGRCFGYDNIRIEGEGRQPVKYAVNSQEAESVRGIFESYAAGNGLKSIVRDLNARGVPSPRSGKRGTGSWAPSAVGSMLRNERYRGKLIWNRENEGVYKGGTKIREPRPESDWITVERPELRIVSDELWEAVQARFGAKQRMGRKTSTGPAPKYLLSGFSRCSKCGGPIQVINGKQGKEIVKLYSCAYHRERGTCEVTTRRPVDTIDELVVGHLESRLLQEDVIVAALAEVRRRLKERTEQPSELPELERRADQLQGEIRRLGEALLSTAQPLDTVTRMLAEREEQLREINARLAAHRALPSVVNMETLRLEKEALARAADLRGMLRRSPVEGRKALEKVLTGPLLFTPIETPNGRRFQVTGEGGLGSVLGVSITGVPNGIRRSARGHDPARIRLDWRSVALA